MIEIRTCFPQHIRLVQVQARQEPDRALSVGQAETACEGLAYSVWDGVRVVMCGGVTQWWDGHGHAWALFSAEAGPAMVAITRFAKQILDVQPYRRVSTTALCNFDAAHRWLWLLGFKMEAERMIGYDAAGRDHALFSRVRGV